MKRPLAVIGLLYMAASAVAVCISPEINLTLTMMTAVLMAAVCFIFRENLRVALVTFIPVGIAFAVIAVCQFNAQALADELGEKTCRISGEICEIPRLQYGKWQYVVDTDSIDIPGARQHIRVMFTSRQPIEEAAEGKRLTCFVTFYQTGGDTGYNRTTSLRADGIEARAYRNPYDATEISEGSGSIRYFPMKIKTFIERGIFRALPKRAAGMLCGMLLGDSEYLSQSTVDHFRATGIAHLLAVSGLHLTLLAGLLEKILRKIRCGRKCRSSVIIGFILFFMAITGFTPSVVRSGIMHSMSQSAKIIGHEPDSFTAMSLAILIMCLINPWAAADIGFQLSVCATLGLLLFADKFSGSLRQAVSGFMKRHGLVIRRRRVAALGAVAVEALGNTVVASLSILPVTAVYFGKVPLVSPLTNILCLYAATLFIVVGLAAALLSLLPLVGWIIALPLKLLDGALCLYLEAVTGAIAGIPFASVRTGYGYMKYLLLFSLAAVACAILAFRLLREAAARRRVRNYLICGLSLMLFASCLSYELSFRSPEIIVFSMSGGGVCVCSVNHTHAVFCEAGGSEYDLYDVREALSERGVRNIDAVAFSDMGKRRSGSLNPLLEAYPPDYIISDPSNNASVTSRLKNRSHSIDFGGGYENGSTVILTFKDCGGKNWLRLCSGGISAVICPDSGNCYDLPQEWRNCDILVAGDELIGLPAVTFGAIVVTADAKNSLTLRSRLYALNYRNIFLSDDGSLSITRKRGRLCVSQMN